MSLWMWYRQWQDLEERWPPGFQPLHRTQGSQVLTLRLYVQRDHSLASPTGKPRTQTDHKATGL